MAMNAGSSNAWPGSQQMHYAAGSYPNPYISSPYSQPSYTPTHNTSVPYTSQATTSTAYAPATNTLLSYTSMPVSPELALAQQQYQQQIANTQALQAQGASDSTHQAYVYTVQEDTASVTGSEQSASHSSNRSHPAFSQGLQSPSQALTTLHSHRPAEQGVHARAALQQGYSGQGVSNYDPTSSSSSQASYEQGHQLQPYQPQQLAASYTGGIAGGQDQQVAQLQQTIYSLNAKLAQLQHTVNDTDLHRQQVQAHNAQLQLQIDTLQRNPTQTQLYPTQLHSPSSLQQASGLTSAGDASLVMQLTAENAELNSQLVQLSQQLEQGLSLTETMMLQHKVTHLEGDVTQLTAQLKASEKSVVGRQELQQKLDEQESSIKQLTTQLQSEKKEDTERAALQQEVLELQVQVKQLKEADQKGLTEQAALQKHVSALEKSTSQLAAQLKSDADVLKQQHQAQLQKVQSENENLVLDLKIGFETAATENEARLQELKTQLLTLGVEHEDERSSLTEQNKRLKSELEEATAAAAASLDSSSSPAVDPQGSGSGPRKPSQGLQAAIQQLVQDKQAVSQLNKQLRREIQELEVLKAKNGDLMEANSELQNKNVALQQAAKSRPEDPDTPKKEEKLKQQLEEANARTERETQRLVISMHENQKLRDHIRGLERDIKSAKERISDLDDRLTYFALQATADGHDAHDPGAVRSKHQPIGMLPDGNESHADGRAGAPLQGGPADEQGPITMSAIARQRREQVKYSASTAAARADSANAEAASDRVVWPKPKTFKPRTHDRRHGDQSDQARAPKFVASPAKDMPSVGAFPDTADQDELTATDHHDGSSDRHEACQA